ncbi:ubiquitin-conjugating enzyme E2 [Aspergillus homomorphus CBS 101889]|uniref:UBC core domain-containing protein n=1 Tax=Aspergillus homomorphus (strain CBS 101889) TaxID=1450537 RepID=A0A395HLG1_ASPHC|nr:hypothetical protein BO97DRAFT_429646 [Aspergillus homomorphus CBS 101889]RAL07114.1 hypothetical protein BO97DRAFT_429646 [Aspergillus homomorphus CBS 101889]
MATTTEPQRDTDTFSVPLQLGDICIALHGSRVCSVEGQYDSPETHLILSYPSTPADILEDFLQTEEVPPGYAFVAFADETQGTSLVPEQELQLISRMWDIGQLVRRQENDAISGKVLNHSNRCTLEPVVSRTTNPLTEEHGPLNFTHKTNFLGPKVTSAQEELPTLLRDVSMCDLEPYEPFTEGDGFIYHQRYGNILRVDRDPVFLTKDNEVVTIYDPLGVESPVWFDSDRLVWLPDDRRTSRVSGHSGADPVHLRLDDVYPGRFAWVNSANMREVHGARVKSSAHGRIGVYTLATPASQYYVQWEIPNVFGIGVDTVTPTEEWETIRASIFLKHAVKCDFVQAPKNRPGGNETHLGLSNWMTLGGVVCFRDPREAATKYPSYQHMPAEESYGYDLNVFRIVSYKSDVTVQWQDGSITTQDAIYLQKARSKPIDEFFPGDLATLKNSVDVNDPSPGGSPICASHSSYCGRKVGVIQKVDSQERVAFIRWYESSTVKWAKDGLSLSRESFHLGGLSTEVTPVSLYELATNPALRRSPGKLVVLVPSTVHCSVIRAPGERPASRNTIGNSSHFSSNTFEAVWRSLEAMKNDIVRTDWFKKSITIDDSPAPTRLSIHYEDFRARLHADFVGMIVKAGTDGTVIVRLAHKDSCMDVEITMEQIMLMPPELFDRIYPSEPLSTPNDVSVDSDTEYDIKDEAVTEDDANGHGAPHITVERFPHASSNALKDSYQAPYYHVTMADAEGDLGVTGAGSPASSSPPAFLVLEGHPPSDHQFISSDVTDSGLRIKRIHKEWRILEKSLPAGIYVRTWESRMDLVRALILGPADTPYEHAPFVFDFHFTGEFPDKPPMAFFHDWTSAEGDINPNLHDSGRVCLSILGSWPTEDPDETWSSSKSTFLQILVSIMGLVLVERPYYNEPGFETLATVEEMRIDSMQYTEKTFLMTRKFIKHALGKPVFGIEDILAWTYLPSPTNAKDMNRPCLLHRAILDARAMIEHHNKAASEQDTHAKDASEYLSRLSLGAVVVLQKLIADLERIEASCRSSGSS